MVTARAVYLPETPSVETLKQVVNDHFKANAPRKKNEERWLALLFREQSENRVTERLAWMLVRQKFNEVPKGIRTYAFRQEDRQSRLPGLSELATKSVMMMGCGSLGSSIATALAASGVSAFVLVDCDVYEPNNAVRHQVGVQAFGIPKAYALADRVSELNPFASSTILLDQIGGVKPFDEEKRLIKELAAVDLIINTTGNHGVSRWLDERCFGYRVPVLHASVTAGAWGGEVVRVIPGSTACWMCWGRQYHDKAPPGDPRGRVFAPGCNQPSFTGTAYECAVVANFACSMAVSTLLRSGGQVPGFKGDYIKWSARNEDGEYVYRTDILETERHASCKLCYEFK